MIFKKKNFPFFHSEKPITLFLVVNKEQQQIDL